MYKFSNKLITESSPYLLQHAHNPVNWYPWGNEALEKAINEDKPILVSIGYAACHWCHVMERESFEDEATATLMNENFVNIKIDREERPDLDHIYMDAVQAMTGSGGWPLNIFLTPDKKPFYGGTYFPPQRAYNRPSWQETLMGVIKAFKERRHEIDAQAENLTDHLLKSNIFGISDNDNENEKIFTPSSLRSAFENIMKSADKEWGGFGKAPKFPQVFTIQFLLRYYYTYRKEDALKQALLSLDKMIDGGIYDQAGGGFARYSTDTEWLVPHFEKMLYDNALLISVLSEAFQITRNSRYKEVIEETMEFINREMLDTSNGFYSTLDADSEGEEGKYYVWDLNEVKKIIGDRPDIYCEYFDISEDGNWENKNILHVKIPLEKFAKEKMLSVPELKSIIRDGNKKLMEARKKRKRPALDDKIILGWNALMNTACSRAFAATGKEAYRHLAIANMNFLLDVFANKNNDGLHHTWKNGIAKFPAFLDDYSFVIEALLSLQEITADVKWLEKAKDICKYVIENFSEEINDSQGQQKSKKGYFFFTPVGQTDVILRKKELYDGAVPSGNSTMANNLWRLALYFDIPEWKERSLVMCSSLEKAITKYPTSFSNWANLMLEITEGTTEIAVLGENASIIHKELLQEYIPNKVLMISKDTNEIFPLLKNKQVLEEATIYLCRNYTCLSPVFSVKELISLINRPSKQ